MTRKSPSEHVFVLTLPLKCEAWQRDRLDKIFRVCNDIKNNLIACEKVRFDHLSRQRAWKRNQEALADAYKKKDKKAIKQYGKIRTEMLEKAGFSLYQFEAQANKYRKHYKGPNGKGYLVSVHVCQKVAASVWKSFETLLYKTGEDVHFSPWSEFTAISGKSNETGIVYSDGIVSFGKMELGVMVDKKSLWLSGRSTFQRNSLLRHFPSLVCKRLEIFRSDHIGRAASDKMPERHRRDSSSNRIWPSRP